MKRDVLTLEINNDESGDREIANYYYIVRIGRRVIREGRVQGHRRDDGWRSLLLQIAQQESELEKVTHER